MTDEPRVLAGEIRIPYKWTAGNVIGTFLATLRDEKKILGARCPECGKVWSPPLDACPVCHADIALADLVPVGPAGRVTSFTRIEAEVWGRPADPPYALAAVRLDGSDTDLIHLVLEPGTIEKLAAGMRVRARISQARKGTLLDILYFHEET
ncbi:MAG: OB-fold domain-containing protein [Planctomycetes bacterium]|nr:OB-fold domain-containing protein [Planctomycetota bacterium]